MADEADKASETYNEHCQYSVALAQKNAAKIQTGQPGECELCDIYFARIVKVQYKDTKVYACAGCRDHFKIG